jgi:hypothetical protein
MSIKFKKISFVSVAIAFGSPLTVAGTVSQERLLAEVSPIITVSPVVRQKLPASSLLVEQKVVDKKVKVISGKEFTFIKSVDKNGKLSTEVLDASGKTISEKEVPNGKVQVVDPRVSNWITKMRTAGNTRSTLLVDIALDLPVSFPDEETEVGRAEVLDGRTTRGNINGREMTQKEMNAYADALAEVEHKRRGARYQSISGALREWAERNKLNDVEGFKESLELGAFGATLALNAEQLSRLIQSRGEELAGIELHEKNADTVSSAMADTNVSSWALPYSTTRGSNIGIYMTESGCANESRISNYNRLAGSETNHSRNVGAIIRAVSPASYLYCRGGAVLPNTSDLDGVAGDPAIYVMNRSNGGNYTTTYNTTDRSWDNFSYTNKLATFVSAGNEGNNSGMVISPAKGLNINTVGNYNDSNNTIASGSSFVDPQTGNDKPEISAPGTNITAGGFTMSGTSMSSPHAAAFAADMMSHSTYLKYRPYLAKAKMLAGATDSITGGYNKVGLGGIDFRSAQWSGYWSWWSGGNNSWNYFDNLDSSSDGYVTRKVYISNGWDDVRVALAWMNKGTYTYNNRNNAHPIGMDLDLRVYDPNGNYVGGSFSWDNPFEKVNFTPSMSGYYTLKVNRYANRDSSSAVRMGLYVNYYN